MQDYRAQAGSVIVIDVDTGEVLAMVNQPSYNPNDRDQLKAGAVPQPRGHGHLRARLERQALHHGGRARLRSVPAGQRGGHLARVLQGRQQGVRGRAQPRRRSILATILAKSSNVGTAKVALSLEARTDLEDAHRRSGSGR